MIASILVAAAGPLVNFALTWFVHVRPNLLLLREGRATRATVIGLKAGFVVMPRIEFKYMTERGEHITRHQHVPREEFPPFNIAEPVWVLYLPRRPKLAQVYGLRSAFAEIVADCPSARPSA